MCWLKCWLLEVIKKGVANSHMIFEKNQRHTCDYQTPFGNLNLGILTKRMSCKEEEDMLEITAEYNMDVDWEPMAKCMIRINVQPRSTEITL